MFNNGLQPSYNEDGEKGFFVTETQLEKNITKENERKESYKKHLEKEHNRKQNKFTNTNMEEIDYICQSLTNAQIGYLMILQCYINYEGNLVKSQKDTTPLKTGDFFKVLGLEGKRQTFYDFKDKCLEKGFLIYKGEEKTYSINKKYIFKGAFKGMGVVSMVTKGMKEGLEGNKPEELAMIFKLQQFVNFKTMALVNNPSEINVDKLEFMKAKDLSEALGVTPSYLSQKIYKLSVNDEYVVAKIKVGKEPTKFMLNPNIFFRGDYAEIQETISVDVAPFFKMNKKK